MRLAVVPVAFGAEAAPATGMVDAACALFAGWSSGGLHVAVATWPALLVAEPAALFTALGGMTALGGPLLAARAAAWVAEHQRPPHPVPLPQGERGPCVGCRQCVPSPLAGEGQGEGALSTRLMLVARGAFHPHCWRIPMAAGGGRYALLPEDAPALTAAHELGHLLLGWADAPGAGAHCLMGAGTGPPGAWLRLAAGWQAPHAITPATTPCGLENGGAWAGLVIERQGDTLLAWSAADRVREIRLAPGDHDRPILALLAAHGVHPKTPEHTPRETSR
jgi:hypothetical protein